MGQAFSLPDVAVTTFEIFRNCGKGCYTAFVLLSVTPQSWMAQAIQLAIDNVRNGKGGPFGALVVRDGELLSTGVNLVTSTNDPTAHAEMVAIRAACKKLGAFQLTGCDVYTSCEPCPMCLGALYWARPKQFYYACDQEAAARAGFDDAFIYNELLLAAELRTIPGHRLSAELASKPFEEWLKSANRIRY